MRRFRVHSYQVTTVDVAARMDDGTPIVGQLNIAIIELVSLGIADATVTLRDELRSVEERDVSRQVFQIGAIVEATFQQVAPPPPKEGDQP